MWLGRQGEKWSIFQKEGNKENQGLEAGLGMMSLGLRHMFGLTEAETVWIEEADHGTSDRSVSHGSGAKGSHGRFRKNVTDENTFGERPGQGRLGELGGKFKKLAGVWLQKARSEGVELLQPES